MSAKKFVESIINGHKVAVFSKTYCPYCTKAKDALNNFNLNSNDYKCVELDQHNDCDAVQDYLKEITGARSVPRVFIGGKFVGGGDDVAKAFKDGSLKTKLSDVGAIK